MRIKHTGDPCDRRAASRIGFGCQPQLLRELLRPYLVVNGRSDVADQAPVKIAVKAGNASAIEERANEARIVERSVDLTIEEAIKIAGDGSQIRSVHVVADIRARHEQRVLSGFGDALVLRQQVGRLQIQNVKIS